MRQRLTHILAALLLAGCGGGGADAAVILNPHIVNTTPPSGSAIITWVAPVRNVAAGAGEGGATLSDMQGYKVYYSLAGGIGPWTLITTIANPATLTYSATGLPDGTVYLCVASYDTAGNIGPCSYAGSKVIP